MPRTKRAKRSMKRSGGAQGAPLAHAFSGVVLPSDVYRPILKPMHGGDGLAYTRSVSPVVKDHRRARRRSTKRHGKWAPVGHALPAGHALPPGFGQMPSSFRPL